MRARARERTDVVKRLVALGIDAGRLFPAHGGEKAKKKAVRGLLHVKWARWTRCSSADPSSASGPSLHQECYPAWGEEVVPVLV